MKKIENNGVGDKKILAARSNERYRKEYEEVQSMLKDEKLYGTSSEETDSKWDFNENMDTLDSGLHYKVTTKCQVSFCFCLSIASPKNLKSRGEGLNSLDAFQWKQVIS